MQRRQALWDHRGGAADVTGRGKPGRPLDREAYFNAAFKILAEVGFLDLTVDTLCAELGVTKGSFYHHFAGMPEFVDALMEAWERSVHEVLTNLVAEDPGTVMDRLATMLQRWPFQSEAALRAWGWTNPIIAAPIRRWDRARGEAGTAWLSRLIDDPERCRLIVHMAQAMMVGMSMLERPLDRDLMIRANREFLRCVVGVELTDGP